MAVVLVDGPVQRLPPDFLIAVLAVADCACLTGRLDGDKGCVYLALKVVVQGNAIACFQLCLFAKLLGCGADIVALVVLSQSNFNDLLVGFCALITGVVLLQSQLVALYGYNIIAVARCCPLVVFDKAAVNGVCLQRNAVFMLQSHSCAVGIQIVGKHLILRLKGLDLAIHSQLIDIVAVRIRGTGSGAGGGIVHAVGIPVQGRAELTFYDAQMLNLFCIVSDEGFESIILLERGLLAAEVVVNKGVIDDQRILCQLEITGVAVHAHTIAGIVVVDGAGVVHMVKVNTVHLDSAKGDCCPLIVSALDNALGDLQSRIMGALLVDVGCHITVLGLRLDRLALADKVKDIIAFRIRLTGGLQLFKVVHTVDVPVKLCIFLISLIDKGVDQLVGFVQVTGDLVALPQFGLLTEGNAVSIGAVVSNEVRMQNCCHAFRSEIIAGYYKLADAAHHVCDPAVCIGAVTADAGVSAYLGNNIALQLQAHIVGAGGIDSGGQLLILGLVLLDLALQHQVENIVAVLVGDTGGLALFCVVHTIGVVVHGAVDPSSGNKCHNRVIIEVGVQVNTIANLKGRHSLADKVCFTVCFYQVDLAIGSNLNGDLIADVLVLAPDALQGNILTVDSGNGVVLSQKFALDGLFSGDHINDITLFVEDQALDSAGIPARIDPVHNFLNAALYLHQLTLVGHLDGVNTVFIGYTGSLTVYHHLGDAIVDVSRHCLLGHEDVSYHALSIGVNANLIHNAQVGEGFADHLCVLLVHVIDAGSIGNGDGLLHAVHGHGRVYYQCGTVKGFDVTGVKHLCCDGSRCNRVNDQTGIVKCQCHQIHHINGVDQLLVGTVQVNMLATHCKTDLVPSFCIWLTRRHIGLGVKVCFPVHVPIQFISACKGVGRTLLLLAAAAKDNGQNHACDHQHRCRNNYRQQPLRGLFC